jgi:hypothetical protein
LAIDLLIFSKSWQCLAMSRVVSLDGTKHDRRKIEFDVRVTYLFDDERYEAF